MKQKLVGKRDAGGSQVLFLNGVRGIAAIVVVMQHGGIMGDLNLGACGVDTFFALSAFLLTMNVFRKCKQLQAQHASHRKWTFAFADYLSKRFFRVYPLFAVVALVVWTLPYASQKQFFKVGKPGAYDLFHVLTFEHHHRFHVFWTLPLEIAYYFLIPAVVAAVIGLRKYWWVVFIPVYVWVVHSGLYKYRTSHHPLAPHLPTFVSGSMAAIICVKLERKIERHAFVFRSWDKFLIRVVEYCALAILLSVGFQGLLFRWVHENPVPQTKGFPYISLPVTVIFIAELLLPGPLGSLLEWNVLRYWGKISFSVYLLHSFVAYSDVVRKQKYYDKVFALFLLTMALSTASYYLIEYPCQQLAARVSRALAQWEASLSSPSASAVRPTVSETEGVVLFTKELHTN